MIFLLLLHGFFIHPGVSQNNTTNRTRENLLSVALIHHQNQTFRLFYNLSTNSSYFFTFRSFGNVDLKFGFYSPSNSLQRQFFLDIFYPISSSKKKDLLLIVCFYFVKSFVDLDIQCRDIRLIGWNSSKSSSNDFLPTYNPFFVPLMYVLSILVLLPVSIQHHRQKKALVLQREKALRRLSMSIHPENGSVSRERLTQTILSKMVENGAIPLDFDFERRSSNKLENLLPLIHICEESQYDEQSNITADDCIAHLFENSPWNCQMEQPLMLSGLTRHALVRQHPVVVNGHELPTIVLISDADDEHQLTVAYSKNKSHRIFFESDV